MSESDEKPFTVNDRRHFTPEGTAREQPETTAAPAAKEPAPPSPGPSDPEAAPGTGAEPPRRAAPAGPVDFSHFLLSLGAQAGALLSGAAAEEGLSGEDALAHAQSIIAILEMLEDKTRERRTPEEDRLLEDLLFELRMAFVQKRRAGAP
jgi:hypothetical protein